MTGKSRLPSPSLIVALLALIMACAGTATAASLISGRQIKKNTVTSKQIKNRILRTKDLHASATRAQGQEGRKGRPWRAGAHGAQRPLLGAGNRGQGSRQHDHALPRRACRKLPRHGQGDAGQQQRRGQRVRCRLAARAVSDSSRTTLPGFSRNTVAFEHGYQSAVSSQIRLSCNGPSISVKDRTISAPRIGAVH